MVRALHTYDTRGERTFGSDVQDFALSGVLADSCSVSAVSWSARGSGGSRAGGGGRQPALRFGPPLVFSDLGVWGMAGGRAH